MNFKVLEAKYSTKCEIKVYLHQKFIKSVNIDVDNVENALTFLSASLINGNSVIMVDNIKYQVQYSNVYCNLVEIFCNLEL